MKICPIVQTSPLNPVFGHNSERRYDVGITRDIVTVKDLYDMEDRIIENQKKIIAKQNKLIAEALKVQSLYSVDPNSDVIKNALDLRLKDLYSNGVIPI